MKYAELFAGIGGFGMGFKALGGECVYANEWDAHAALTYEVNNAMKIDQRDVREVNADSVPDHDVLLAGFPCQTFSTAGIAAARGRPIGMACPKRGRLFFEIVRITTAKRPQAVVMENVKNFVTFDKGRALKTIRDAFEALGYGLFYRVVDAIAWLPQRRKRVFMVALRHKKMFGLKVAMDTIYESADSVRLEGKPHHVLSSILHDPRERVDPPFTIRDRSSPEAWERQLTVVHPKYTLSDKAWAGIRRRKVNYAETSGGFGYNLVGPEDCAATLLARYGKEPAEILLRQEGKNPRKLTPRECLRLMGFPRNVDWPEYDDVFILHGSDAKNYRAIGNAVCPPVSKAVAATVLQAL